MTTIASTEAAARAEARDLDLGDLDAVVGGGGLAKTGAGVLILSGANTYSGQTRVNEGVLV